MKGPSPSAIGCPGAHHPEPLALAGYPPVERAAGPHQAAEDLREVRRVQRHQSHPVQHRALDPVDYGVLNLAMRLVPPPEEDVGGSQHGLGEPMLGLIQRRRAGSREAVCG